MAQTTPTQPSNIGDSNLHRNNILPGYNNTHRYEEHAEIMNWLCPLQLNKYNYRCLRTERFDGVGDWFLEAKEYQEWTNGAGGADNAVLFCSGSPGVGKTFLR